MAEIQIDENELNRLKKNSENYEELKKLFFNKNFGTASKSSIELLMFHQYIVDQEQKSKDPAMPGVIKYEEVSDFKIGCDLGLTSSRVRSLKLKERLVYPPKNKDWKNYILKLLEFAKINEKDQTVEFTIHHPWLFSKIQDEIESRNGQVYIHLNKNLLSLPLDSFVILVNIAYGREGMAKEEIDAIKEYMKKEKKLGWKDIGNKALEWAKKAKDVNVLAKGVLAFLLGN